MPALAPVIPFIVGAATVVSTYMAYEQGQAAKKAARHNERIQQENARIQREQTALQVQQADRERILRLGAVRVAQAKSGGTAGQGSVLDVLGDVAAQSELERQDILRGGSIRARGFESQATLSRMGGRAAEKQGYLSAGTELLSGTASTYDSYQRVN